ncbi:MAG: hypothetical protein AAGF12_07595 [Myxococcota bacterium]
MGSWSEVIDATLRGDLGSGDEHIAELALRTDTLARAELTSLLSARWLVDPARGRMTPATLLAEEFGDADGGLAATLAAVLSVRAAVLEMNMDELAVSAALLHRRIVGGEPMSAIHAKAAHAWLALGRGQCDEAVSWFAGIRAHELGWLGAEIDALRALAWAESGDVDRGLALARELSMRVQEIPIRHVQVLAQFVLGKMRRLTGRPVLEMHILLATQPYASAVWNRWFSWELFLASGDVPAARLGHGFPEPAFDALRAARRGDRAEFVRLRAIAEDTVRWVPFALEQRVVFDAVDPLEVAVEDGVASWVFGGPSGPPPAVRAVAARGREDIKASLVLAGPQRRARRFCEVGAALVGDGAVRLEAPSKAVRVLTLLAVLALANDWVLADSAFRAVYAFAYDRQVHANLFRALLHRTRKLIKGLGSIDNRHGRLRIRWTCDVAFVDPRDEASLEDALLQFLAVRRSGKAREAASVLDVPLRTVQHALQQLSLEGAVGVHREGNRLEYSLEDTCFSQSGLFGAR